MRPPSSRVFCRIRPCACKNPRDGSTGRNGFESQSLRRGSPTACPQGCAQRGPIVKGHESAYGDLRFLALKSDSCRKISITLIDPCPGCSSVAAKASAAKASFKRAPEELAVILLLLGWARVGSRVELLVCGGAFQLSAVPVHRNGGRRFLCTVPWSIKRDTESARFYVRWQ